MTDDIASGAVGDATDGLPDGSASVRLAILKALGDNTRYAIYLELARSPSPRSTAEVAETLGLHPNTVRPHLERMRDVGLLDVQTGTFGAAPGSNYLVFRGKRNVLARSNVGLFVSNRQATSASMERAEAQPAEAST